MASTPNQGTTSHKVDKFATELSWMPLVEYDAGSQSMKITFGNGTVKSYPNMSPSAYLSFKSSPTPAQYYNKMIRGKVMSNTIISGAIGRKKSTPLQRVKKQGDLNNGVKRTDSTNQLAGTVARAFAGANRHS